MHRYSSQSPRGALCLALALAIGVTSVQAVTRELPASTTDQTAAFQKLVDASTVGDVVVLKTGNHFLGGTVVVKASGITVRGEKDSKIFKLKTSSVSCLDARCDGATFDNLYIDGANRPEPCMRVFGHSNNIVNSTFRNSDNSGLLLHGCSSNTVQGCKVFYNFMVGISQSGCTNQIIRDCQIYENGAEGLTIDVGSHDCQVFGNWIHKNNLPHRGVGGIGIDASHRADIHHNTIDANGGSGITLQNNLCCGIDACNIHDNANISFNEHCAVKKRLAQPITRFTFTNNVCNGNPKGIVCEAKP